MFSSTNINPTATTVHSILQNSVPPSQLVTSEQQIVKSTVLTKPYLSEEPISDIDSSIIETLALVKENLALSAHFFGETESSFEDFSQTSRQSLTQYLDKMDDLASQEKTKKEFVDIKDKQSKNSTKNPKSTNLAKTKSQKVTQDQNIHQTSKTRDVGLYVLCDGCEKTRYLPDVNDPLDLPEKWYCHMNPDPEYNSCASPDYHISPEVMGRLIANEYNAGSLVWAKMDGYPWWPAMVDDCPKQGNYFMLNDDNSEVPSFYHVTFFDSKSVTRAWISTKNLKPFLPDIKGVSRHKNLAEYKARLKNANEQALRASKMSVFERLETFGWAKKGKKRAKANKHTEKKTKKSAGEDDKLT